MDAAPLDSPRQANGLEAQLRAVEEQLGAAEKQTSALLNTMKRLRRAAREGAVTSLGAGIGAVQTELSRMGEALAQTAELAGSYDVAEAFASGAWLDELGRGRQSRRRGAGAARWACDRLPGGAAARWTGAGRAGRAQAGTAHPAQLPRRPAQGVAATAGAVQRPPVPGPACSRCTRARRAPRIPAWRPTQPGPGPLVALAELHDQLTLLPAAAADYPQEEFVTDLLRLDRQPDATSQRRAPVRARRLHRAQRRQAADPVRRDRRAARLLRHPLHPGAVPMDVLTTTAAATR